MALDANKNIIFGKSADVEFDSFLQEQLTQTENADASPYIQKLNTYLYRRLGLQRKLFGQNKFTRFVKESAAINLEIFKFLDANHEHFNTSEKALIAAKILTIINPSSEGYDKKEASILREDGSGYTTSAQLSLDAASAILKEIKLPFHLFRIVHLYGAADVFQKLSEDHVLPQQMRLAYKNWERVNKKFIEAQRKLIMLEEAREAFTRMRDEATDPTTKKFYEFFRMFHETSISNGHVAVCHTDLFDKGEIAKMEKNWRLFMIEMAVQCQDILEKDGINHDYFKSLIFQALPLNELEITKHPLNHNMDVEVYFEFVKFIKAEDDLKALLETQIFPHVKFSDYEVWRDTGRMPVTVEVIDTPIITAEMVDSRVTYINVDHPLVTRGKREEGMGYRPVDEAEQLEAGMSDNTLNRERTEKIKDALLADAASGVKHITIRRDVRQIDCKSGRPYHLIDVEMTDGSRSRIAACDFVGNMTFIERDAPDYVDGQTLDLENLRKNPKTWHVVHINDKQWIEGIQEVLYTPLDTMSPALKNKSYWYSLGDVAVQSLVTKFMIAGRAPTTVDTKTLIDCGPLEGRSKYNLLYSAWNRGSIKGFEKGTTFSIVLKSLTEGDDAIMPWLKKFENKSQITAEAILSASERFKREWGFAVQDGFYDELKIDTIDARIKPTDVDFRRTGIEADIAFKFRAVAVNDNDLQEWGRYPDSLDDFMQLAGVIAAPAREIA